MAKKPGARSSKTKLKRKTLKTLQPRAVRNTQQGKVVGGKMAAASHALNCPG